MWDSMLLFIRLPECMCPVCRLCLVSCNQFLHKMDGCEPTMGGVQTQILTLTPPQTIRAPRGRRSFGGVGGAQRGSQVTEHTYLKMIPSSH